MIRLVQESDARGILEIYGPVVRDTVISFEFEVPDEAEIRHRIETYSKKYPWLVWEEQGRIAGYAYGSPHRSRAAYRWSVEVSAYVHTDCYRKGIGKKLYERLFALLKLQGYHLALAGVTQPNPRSEAFHKALGFEPVGLYRQVGYKMGAWRDTRWWQLPLGAYSSLPERGPLTLEEAKRLQEWQDVIEGE